MGNAVSFVGRLLLGALFIVAGARKALGYAGTVDYIKSAKLPYPAGAALPYPEILAGGTIGLEIVAGLMLIAGYHARLAALALALFSVAAAVLFHQFWAVDAAQFGNQLNHFLKNLAVAGGLLLVTTSATHSPLSHGGARS